MKELLQAINKTNNPLFKYWNLFDERERNCLYLYYMCGWTQLKIAEHCGCVEARVCQLLKSGRNSVKQLIQNREPNYDLIEEIETASELQW